MDLLNCALSLGLSCFTPSHALVGAYTQPAFGAVTAAAPAKATPTNRPAWRPEKASSVLQLVQAFYDSSKDLKADFRQYYWNPSYGSNTESAGKLRLKKPGKMVWDYRGKSEADYYADGDQLWMVEHDTRQVIRTSVKKNNEVMAAMKFLFGGQQLIREFKVRYANDAKASKFGDSKHHVLQLKPKKANKHYKGLLLVVDAATGRVDSFVVYNQDKSVNRFRLRNIKVNTGLAESQFRFKTPKGYVETKE